jgi:hypothetical protein
MKIRFANKEINSSFRGWDRDSWCHVVKLKMVLVIDMSPSSNDIGDPHHETSVRLNRE